MPEEHNCLILILASSKAKYRDHAQKCKPLLHCTESLEHGGIEIFDL